jgi:hypothetical protein
LDKNVDRETEDYGANSEELFLSESSEHQSSTIMPPSAILQPPPSFPLSPDHGGISAYRRRRTCLDHAPNCFYLRSLCNNNFYIPIMRKNWYFTKTLKCVSILVDYEKHLLLSDIF